jgi:Alcohol dehydrogenase GroES-like domain
MPHSYPSPALSAPNSAAQTTRPSWTTHSPLERYAPVVAGPRPVENAIAAGMPKMVEHEFPVTLGRDYAGIVEQIGPNVTSFSIGDEVFGFIPGISPSCMPEAGLS